EAGHGAFASVLVSTRDGRSHVFAAVNYNGRVLFLDPQHGYRSTSFPFDTSGPDGITRVSVAALDAHAHPVHVGPDGHGQHIDLHTDVDPTAGVHIATQAEEQRILQSLPAPVRVAIEQSVVAADPVAQRVQADLQRYVDQLGGPDAPHLVDTGTRVKGAGSI